MHTFIILLLLPLLLIAQNAPPPQEIEEELESAESQFKKAKEMFSPWYTGPLITPGVSMMPPGNGNTQPYLFFTDNYASFNSERKSVTLPNNWFQIQFAANIQTGITDNLDLNIAGAAFGNWQDGRTGGGYGDTSATAGFLIFKQTPYIPAFKFTVKQVFPTGSYKKLKSSTVDGVGGGAYSTQFGFGISKVLFWATKHPLNIRTFLGYQLSTVVHVSDVNTYGGAKGCRGKVRPGNNFSADLGIEYSLTQRWVAALDAVYTATNRTKFHGNAGTLPNGDPSSVGGGYSDNLSFAPAIEYNWNPNVGLIVGGWFSVYGRNSLNFGSGIISLTYSFP
jgi:hypothetical protein